MDASGPRSTTSPGNKDTSRSNPEANINLDSVWMETESEALRSPEVHLINILQTPGSAGFIAELGVFPLVKEIRRKSIVLTPMEYYTPNAGFLANLVSFYPISKPYSQQQFEGCRLLHDCQDGPDLWLLISMWLKPGTDVNRGR